MSNMQNLYIGQAGHLLVMSELLYRGWNVATPQVDRGDDVFVVKDENGELKRIQVKTTKGKKLKKGYSGKYNLRLNQLRTPYTPDLHYVFAMRTLSGWNDFVVIDRAKLFEHYTNQNIGYVNNNILQIQIRIESNKAYCSKVDFSTYRNDWSRFPIIQH